MNNRDFPTFSVIVPVHNKERYVKDALYSILNQTYSDFEIIVVDDCSSDNSLHVCQSIQDSRVEIFRRFEPGPGGYAARNFGIQKAKGEWIAFLDADDEWYPDHLRNMLDLACEFDHVNILSSARHLKHKDIIEKDSYGCLFSKSHLLTLEDYLQNAIRGRRAIGTNSICIRRSSLKSFNVFPAGRAKRSGDLYAWVVLVAQQGKLAWSPKVASLSNRDVVGVSLTNIPSIELAREMVSELEGYCSRLQLSLLKKYSNRLIAIAWGESVALGKRIPSLSRYFYWDAEILFCLIWTFVSWLPKNLLISIKQVRSTLISIRRRFGSAWRRN